jgi:hypothetical protein
VLVLRSALDRLLYGLFFFTLGCVGLGFAGYLVATDDDALGWVLVGITALMTLSGLVFVVDGVRMRLSGYRWTEAP